MNFLGLDIGEKRIGVATSASGILATQYATIDNISQEAAIIKILEICQKEKTEKIVVGLPKLKSGDETSQTKYVRNFVFKLNEAIKLPVVFVDEYLSSKEAEENLIKANPKITKNSRAMRDLIDQQAAVIILEQYFSQTRN